MIFFWVIWKIEYDLIKHLETLSYLLQWSLNNMSVLLKFKLFIRQYSKGILRPYQPLVWNDGNSFQNRQIKFDSFPVLLTHQKNIKISFQALNNFNSRIRNESRPKTSNHDGHFVYNTFRFSLRLYWLSFFVLPFFLRFPGSFRPCIIWLWTLFIFVALDLISVYDSW